MKKKMKSLIYIFVISFYVSVSLSSPINEKNIGYFWHVSDFHYDANYSTMGDPSQMCHQGKKTGENIGNYGNYLCDAPWQLIQSAIQGMFNLEPDPDFIVWTGDSVPHVDDTDLDPQKVYSLIGNVTDALMSRFPNTTIYPTLGNHDPYPSNQMPYAVDKTSYYKDILEQSHWDKVLNLNESDEFLNGGYYSSLITEKLRLLGVNTNLYYDQDKLTKGLSDPANQLQWLEKQLQRARKQFEKVYIVAHVPPGVFELVENMYWFYADYNHRYINLLMKYSDIIEAQLYGHEHTDSFRILFDESGSPVSSLFLSPAVTPWKSTLPGVGANNPSIRLFQYDRNNGVLQKYQQYFLNLTEANVVNNASGWKLEYDTSDDYGLDDLKPSKLHNLVKGFTSQENDLFKKYLKFNSVKWDNSGVCNGTCFLRHTCAITQLDIDNYKTCMAGGATTSHPPSTTPGHHHHSTPAPQVPDYMYYVVGGLACAVFLLFLVIACICFRKRRIRPPRYAKFGSLSVNG